MAESDAGTVLDSNPQPRGSKNHSGVGISLSIWPPSQRTRDAVVNRLIETLSTPSVLSKRYGIVPRDEADTAARRIEEEAFDCANSASATAEDDGLEILQMYSKEISKRMLETVKARPKSDSAVDNDASMDTVEESGAEDASSVEEEEA